jgi:hypothetical protein
VFVESLPSVFEEGWGIQCRIQRFVILHHFRYCELNSLPYPSERFHASRALQHTNAPRSTITSY